MVNPSFSGYLIRVFYVYILTNRRQTVFYTGCTKELKNHSTIRVTLEMGAWRTIELSARDKEFSKGKIAKPVEFGRKRMINTYRGGYVLLTMPTNPKMSDQGTVWESAGCTERIRNEPFF